MHQLTTLGNTRRAGGVKEDEQVRWLGGFWQSGGSRKMQQVFGQKHVALILVKQITQFFIGNQQS